MTAQPITPCTRQEYLAQERTAQVRHEYLRGEVWAMAGGTYRHGLLASRMIQLLARALEGRPCAVVTADVRVRVEATDLLTYPDVSVVCGKRAASPADPDALTNPTVLVEILSEPTERYDRGAKFSHYQRLEALREYVLVAQDRTLVEVYRRGPGDTWEYQPYGEHAQVELKSLQVRLAVDELYFDPTA